MKRLILIEGGDGSGKSTQAAKLVTYLRNKGIKADLISFPNYDSAPGRVITEMLSGKYSKDAGDINPYAGSTMYAIDRYVSMNFVFNKILEDNEVIVLNRYTYSNAIHQGSKFLKGDRAESMVQLQAFIVWLEKLEFERFHLPRPTDIIYLDVLPEMSAQLLTERYKGDESKKDIQEQTDFLIKSHESAILCSEICGWARINCMQDSETMAIRSIDDIHADVLEALEYEQR